MWGGEVEAHRGVLLQLRVAMEFGAVVGSDGLEPIRTAGNELGGAGIELGSGARVELTDHQVSALTLDHGDNAVLAAFAEHRVDLPMTKAASAFNTLRTFADVAFARQAAPTVVGAIAFTALLASLAQVSVQVAPCGLVGPDVQVDGLVADVHLAGTTEIP